MGVDFDGISTAGGIVAGFAVTAFIFRIQRESSFRSKRAVYWLPPADLLLILALVVDLLGVFSIPLVADSVDIARFALGLACLMLAGYAPAMAGHYDILWGRVPKSIAEKRARPPNKNGDYPWMTGQELGVLIAVGVISVGYIVAYAAFN